MGRLRGIRLGLIGVLALLALGAIRCSRGQDSSQITSKVQDRIRADRRLMMARIQVRQSNGIVTLAGYVERNDQRVATVQDAAQIEGVRVVVDNLRVIDPRPQSLVAAVQEPHASVARTAGRSKAPSLSRGKAFHAALPADGLRRPVPAEIGASVSRSSMASSTRVVPAASVSLDTRSADSELPGGSASASPAPPPPVVASPRAPEQVAVPYGTTLAVRLTESLSSDLNQQGDIFLASLASPVTIGDRVVIPAAAAIQGKVVEVRNAGRFSGRSTLAIEVTRLAYNGKTYELRSSQYSKLGRSRDTHAAAAIASGAGVGAIIGAILGGGKGAAIGAVIGAGAGTGIQAATKTAEVQLPAESILSFRLETLLMVIPSSTLQGAQGAGPDSSNDPFSSDDRPVLKRRPGSPPPETDTNTPGASTPPDQGPPEAPTPPEPRPN